MEGGYILVVGITCFLGWDGDGSLMEIRDSWAAFFFLVGFSLSGCIVKLNASCDFFSKIYGPFVLAVCEHCFFYVLTDLK